MQLQTNTSIQKRSKLKVSTFLVGLMIVLIPIAIAVFMNMPQVMEWVKMSFSEIGKATLVGFSSLPVILFVTIKGGERWYAKWWTWILLAITIITILIICLLGSVDSGASMETMNYMKGAVEKGFY